MAFEVYRYFGKSKLLGNKRRFDGTTSLCCNVAAIKNKIGLRDELNSKKRTNKQTNWQTNGQKYLKTSKYISREILFRPFRASVFKCALVARNYDEAASVGTYGCRK